MAQNSKDAQKRASRAERRAAEAAAMKARAEQMEKERKQQTIIGAIVVAGARSLQCGECRSCHCGCLVDGNPGFADQGKPP